jgi:signal transduction histidine kinase
MFAAGRRTYHESVFRLDLRRLGAVRWAYLLDAAAAVALTAVSVLGVRTPAIVLRVPADVTPPALPPDIDKADLVRVAVAAGYEVAPMDRAVQIWWVFTAFLFAALLLQRRRPVLALILAGIGGAGHYLDLYPQTEGYFYLLWSPPAIPPQPIDLAVLIILVTVVSQLRTRWAAAIVCSAVLAAGYAVYAAKVMTIDSHASGTPVIGVAAVTAIVIVFVLGDVIRGHRSRALALEAAAADLQRERQRAALAVAAERARITREIHDVVAHSLAVMVAQVQAAQAARQRHPDRTTRALEEVVTVGRASLGEMRRLLGAFGDATGSDGLAPQPGLDALPALVERVRATGMPVRLDIEGEPAELPATVELSAHRIVQEALTNVLKHAGTGAQAAVSVAYRPDSLDIEVRDDGVGAYNGMPGNGLRGIAERVGLLGGEPSVGPDPVQGFVVWARLPLAVTGGTE